MRPDHILLILVDGLGWPPEPLESSVYRDCPALFRMMREHGVPVDAGLNVEGLPQSATGQAAILTGVNAAQLTGRHMSGFPDSQLRELVGKENIFAKLSSLGLSSTFANAYARLPEMNMPVSLRSVTTVAAMAALPRLRNRDDLLAGEAVYHDATRRWLRDKGDRDIPVIQEPEAAKHLVRITRKFDFCLYEYFLTDHAGHRGAEKEKKKILSSLDQVLAVLLEGMDFDRELLLLISDHGNIESSADRFHTSNPVPWIAMGRGAEEALQAVSSISQVTPAITRLYGGPG